MFDPYREWLAIPKDQRPPTYYQLLDVRPDETNVQLIDEQALRRASQVRPYQIGANARECARLLNEIALARATLRNPERRKEYDARLNGPARQESVAADAAPVPTAAASVPVAAAPMALPFRPGGAAAAAAADEPLPEGDAVASVYAEQARHHDGEPHQHYRRAADSFWTDPAGWGYLALLAFAGGLAFSLTSAALRPSAGTGPETSRPDKTAAPVVRPGTSVDGKHDAP